MISSAGARNAVLAISNVAISSSRQWGELIRHGGMGRCLTQFQRRNVQHWLPHLLTKETTARWLVIAAAALCLCRGGLQQRWFMPQAIGSR